MPAWSLPRSLTDLLMAFRPCFTAPTFTTFSWLVVGLVAQPGTRTVTGMLVGARLAGGIWHHSRAHRFFAAARWSADALGLVVLEVVVACLLGPVAPLRLVVDDTLFRRSGRKVFGAAWHHDPLGKGAKPVAWANCWVVVGVLVELPFVPQRVVCLPVVCRLWRPKQPDRTKLALAVELVGLVAERCPDRQVHLTGDAAYAGKTLRALPTQVTVTTRLRSDAALYELAPPRTGRPGRPRRKGKRMPELIVLAALTRVRFKQTVVCCYGELRVVELACLRCLWYGTFGPRPVQVVLVRSPGAPDGYDLALVTTDLAATPAELVQRYAARWQVEVLFQEARQDAGVGQARNRTRTAVERTVPFGLVCVSLAVCWYALHGQPAADVATRRALAPWYRAKHMVSFADMLLALRRVILAAQYLSASLVEPTTAEILAVQRAWAAAAA